MSKNTAEAAVVPAVETRETFYQDLQILSKRVGKSVVLVKGSRFGTGSGVVWDKKGLVLTNNHVLPYQKARVILANGTHSSAKVISRSRRFDLALLSLENVSEKSLDPISVGDSLSLRVGELVFAVGNPQGERNAITMGVLSATRGIAWRRGPSEVLKLSLQLRPGNSGGALVNAKGQLIGIPHMVSGSGLAFAIPSHVIQKFLSGNLRKPNRLGVGVQWVSLSDFPLKFQSFCASSGLLLLSIVPGSLAEKSGLLLGDILIGIANVQEETMIEPIDQVSLARHLLLGDSMQLAISRAGTLHWIEIIP